MNKPLIALAVFGIPGLLIVLTNPFTAYGDAIKPGLGPLMNGGIGGGLLLIVAPIAAWLFKGK